MGFGVTVDAEAWCGGKEATYIGGGSICIFDEIYVTCRITN